MNLPEHVHAHYVAGRRLKVLGGHLAGLLASGARVLDVGCGDGGLTSLIAQARPDLTFEGLDVLARPDARIPVLQFDGQTIPKPQGSVDTVMLIDTLHHADSPMALLREAVRVTRGTILIKDHLLEGVFAGPTLRLMDHVGNARHGVALPYHYWTRRQWEEAFASLGLRIVTWTTHLHLYPWPASLIFDRALHLLTTVEVPASR